MILVMLGTQNNSFHRLLEKIDQLVEDGKINDQIPESECPRRSPVQAAIENLEQQADYIITHGGVGSIINSIEKGKKVIAVPRLKKYGEHVNDHQLDIVESFDKLGYIIGITDVSQLEEALQRVKEFRPKKYIQNTGNIISIIQNFIDNN
ncbi:MAG: hypothetical protein BHW02_03490 [Clostridium sp. 28_12]|nr:MAG: hypothetical protein BHW02_03490 [Clostridium sp. 28_12]